MHLDAKAMTQKCNVVLNLEKNLVENQNNYASIQAKGLKITQNS